jgi:Flp pilus assembly protein TadG
MKRIRKASGGGWGAWTPAKFAELAEPEAEPAGTTRGQILVLFALFAVGLMGMLGLATDVGYAMAARRAAQGAADAGALAGARQLAKYTSGSVSIQSEVNTVVTANNFGPSITPSLYNCEYIGNNWAVVGTCNQSIPSNAAGVRVRTRVTFQPFFIQVVPGVSNNLVAAGYAKARVENADVAALDAPFIICGKASWAVMSASGSAIDQNIPILNASNKINSAAVGVTYRVHDPQLANHYAADCNSKADRFKGLADQSRNSGITSLPAWFGYDTGTKAGPTRAKVNGTEGCATNTSEPYNCVMILPIATNSPAESGNAKQVYVVGYAAFWVTTVDANSHNARLLDDYLIKGVEGAPNWCRDCGGVVVVRLIW